MSAILPWLAIIVPILVVGTGILWIGTDGFQDWEAVIDSSIAIGIILIVIGSVLSVAWGIGKLSAEPEKQTPESNEATIRNDTGRP